MTPAGVAARARICHACPMETSRIARLAREAEEKLAKASPLSRDEQMALLARLLALQETRKERKYSAT
jgi:hypothetical protein